MDLVIRSYAGERQPTIYNFDPTSIVPDVVAATVVGDQTAIVNGGGKILGRLQRSDRSGPEGPVPPRGDLRLRARDRPELRGRREVRLPGPAPHRRGLPLHPGRRLLRRQPDRGPDGEPHLARLRLDVYGAQGTAHLPRVPVRHDEAVLGQLDGARLVRLLDAAGQLRRPLRAVHAAARHGGSEHLGPLRLLRLLHRRASHQRRCTARDFERRSVERPPAASRSSRASTSRPSTCRSASSPTTRPERRSRGSASRTPTRGRSSSSRRAARRAASPRPTTPTSTSAIRCSSVR